MRSRPWRVTSLNSYEPEQLQHIARVARGQIYSLGQQVEIDEKIWSEWKYGVLFDSVEVVDAASDKSKKGDESLEENLNPQEN